MWKSIASLETRPVVKSSATTVDWCWKTTSSTRAPSGVSFLPSKATSAARTGAPMTVMLHDKGLSTDIDWQNKDYSGKTINSRYRSQFYRMRKWQKRSRVSNATERNLAMALAELDRMASRLEAAQVRP